MDDQEEFLENVDDLENADALEDVEIIYSESEDEEYGMQELEYIEDGDLDNQIEVEVVDMAKSTFTKHTKSVFCSDVSKDDTLAVTGGEDDMAYVWHTETGEVVIECTGHKDSVTEVGFNYNDKYVATGDMAGMIQIWSVKDKKLMWCFESADLEWMLWHPLVNVLICGCQSGDIYIWEIPSGNLKVSPSPGLCHCTCGKLLPDGKQLLTGYDNGQVRLLSLKEMQPLWTNTDSDAVHNIEVNNEGTLAITIPNANVIKLNDGKTIGKILLEGETEIEAALFNTELDAVITGSLTGQICVWQLGKYTIRHQAKIENAVTMLKFSNNGNVIVGTSAGDVYVCNVKSGSLIQTLTGHKSDVLSLTVFKGSNRILTTSDDGTAKIFEIEN